MHSRVSAILDSKLRGYDKGVVTGIALSFALIALAVLFSGASLRFLSPWGFLVVVGGTIGAGLVNFSVEDLQNAWQAFRGVVVERHFDPQRRIRTLVKVARYARKDGLLALQAELPKCGDPFLRYAIELTMDGQSSDEVCRVLNNELESQIRKQLRVVEIFETLGSYAPAMGLIGTLIGLVQMLGNLGDPKLVGIGMSVALMTTLYGAILANLVLLPVAGKLRIRTEQEALLRQITIEAAASLVTQENPIVLEQRLQSFLPNVVGG